MGYGSSYKPRRINYRKCLYGNVQCPQKSYNKNNSSGYYSGNLITSGFLSTDVYQQSNQIQKATSFGTKGTLITFANRKLNAFGSWQGSPYGSKSPPRNKF